MPTSTPNLSLYKYDTTTDGDLTFNFTNGLNNNWDKIDTYCKGLSDDKADTSAVNSALALKADTSTVNSALALKADTSAVNSVLALKADKTSLHALKSYSDNGELLTDAEGLADVTNYAHSTFDLSKFTVVGSPIITDDGIASGFTTNASIRVPNVITDKPFIIKGVVHLGNVEQENIIGCSGQDWVKFIGTEFNNAIVNLGKDENENIIKLPINNGFVKNKSYVYELSWDGITYNFSTTRLDTNETKYATPVVAGASQLLKNAPALSLGINYSHPDSVPLKGSIDLKQFSITVDGVEVFSGNKTGIDTIKPDNYTVVGTPTISADGVLSTSDGSNCVQFVQGALGNNWDIVFPYNKPQAIAWHSVGTIFRNNSSYDSFSIGSYGSSYYLWLKDIDGTNLATAFSTTSSGSFGDCLIKLSCRIINGVYTLNIYSSFDDGSNWNLDKTITSSVAFYPCNNAMADVRIYTHLADTNASIDLNAFKIYVNGNLVYQPCLKIPYTQSATKYGSKIVDAVYRDRVQDAWEQNFSQRYYTLDEANGNFTLPQGEIYGQIGNNTGLINTVNSALETYKNRSFVSSSQSISSGTTDLSTYLPDDGAIYNVWVENFLEATGSGIYTTVSSDIFPSTDFNGLDNDGGRHSMSWGVIVVPVGVGRTITIDKSSTLKGYMRA